MRKETQTMKDNDATPPEGAVLLPISFTPPPKGFIGWRIDVNEATDNPQWVGPKRWHGADRFNGCRYAAPEGSEVVRLNTPESETPRSHVPDMAQQLTRIYEDRVVSETPRTDAHVKSLKKTPDCFCEADFARQLELENRRLRDALYDMVAVAKADGWKEATTGRQIILKAAEEALAGRGNNLPGSSGL